MQADGHWFSSYAQPLGLDGQLETDKYIGAELDLVFGFVISDSVSLQGGYSQLFVSDAFKNTQSFCWACQAHWRQCQLLRLCHNIVLLQNSTLKKNVKENEN